MHLLVVKQELQELQEQLGQVFAQLLVSLAELEPVPPEWKSLARTLLELESQVLALMQPHHRQRQRVQDVHQLELLYRLEHQLPEARQQLVKGSRYRPYLLKLLGALHQLQQNLQRFSTNV
jgi:hypothetical protein